jgi:glycosyltransferase involved in cell wall biosynthesis
MVLIPAYNAGDAVGRVVREAKILSPDLKVVVIDDGSTDGTASIAAEAGAAVVRHERNMGKAEALRTGYGELLRSDRAAVITLDADGQHSPAEIPSLVRAWIDQDADIVIGTRKRELGTMPPQRILSNTLSSWLITLAAGQSVADSQSGYRLLGRRVLEAVKTRTSGYDAESEILLRASWQGFKIASAPVSTIYGGERSFINPFKQPLLFIGLMVKSIFWRFEGVGKGCEDNQYPPDK